MGHVTQECFGDRFHLMVVEDKVKAPQAVIEMLRTLLSTSKAEGNFSFHPKGTLEPPHDALRPRMSMHPHGGEILVSMFWGKTPEDTMTGSLFPPRNWRPIELHKTMVQPLAFLNSDGWTNAKLSGSMLQPIAPPASAPKIEPIKVQAKAPAPAAAAPPKAQGAQEEAPGGLDEAIALRLFSKAEKGIIRYYRIRDYLLRHHPQPGNRGFVAQTAARLVEKGFLRRVSYDAADSEWQFTESFLHTHGLVAEGYEPLPVAAPRHAGRKPAPAADAPAPAAQPQAPALVAAVAPPAVPTSPALGKLKQLHADLERHVAGQKQLEEVAEANKRALDATKDKIEALKAEIISVSAGLAQE